MTRKQLIEILKLPDEDTQKDIDTLLKHININEEKVLNEYKKELIYKIADMSCINSKEKKDETGEFSKSSIDIKHEILKLINNKQKILEQQLNT